MKLLLFILFNIYKIVISNNKKNIPTNFEIGNNRNLIIKTTIIKIKHRGNYTIKGNYNDLTILINSSNVIVNLFNGIYNSFSSSNIIVEKRLSNIIINVNNSNFNSKQFIKIKKFSKVKLNIISSRIKNNVFFHVEKKYNIKINGQIKYNNNDDFKKISENILTNRDIIFFCENKDFIIKNLYMTFNSEHKISKQFFQNFNKKSSNINKCKLKLVEKIILTMTSWRKRINKCHRSIETLLRNTIKPYKLILNLSKEEFPKKEKQLPTTLLNLRTKYKNFKINWVFKNNNVFKKLIPTLYKYKNDLIITVDDDVLYPKFLIEKMIKEFRRKGSKSPMSFGGKQTDWWVSKYHKIPAHYGACSIVKFVFFKYKLLELYYKTTEPRINKGIKCFDDFLYTYAALLNGYRYKRSKKFSCRRYVNSSPKLRGGFSNIKNKKRSWKRYHRAVRDYIRKKYRVSFKDLARRKKRYLYIGK